MKITKKVACSFLVRYQHLDASYPLVGAEGVLEYIKKVGCIQYDPLNIVGRNPDLVLQARICDYKTDMLTHLLYEQRSLMDGWDKVMSIYCTKDWPYFHYVRAQRGKETISTLQHRNSDDALHYVDAVIEAITQNGPMQPKHIKLGSAGSGRWGHKNLSSATMDYLWHIGKLGVFKKINVTKVYDLIENILPASILNQPSPFNTEYDFFKWYVYRRIGSIGMLWNRNGGGWLGTLMPDKKLRQQILNEYVESGLIQDIEVEGLSDKFYIKSRDTIQLKETTQSHDTAQIHGNLFKNHAQNTNETVRFIAPLDNILWDRDMLAKLFDFEYTWEVYIPVAKRKFGYYVIPVLHKNRFIARFEPEKSASHIRIKNWWWEKGVEVSKDLIDHIMQEMERFSLSLEKTQGVHESVYGIIKGV